MEKSLIGKRHFRRYKVSSAFRFSLHGKESRARVIDYSPHGIGVVIEDSHPPGKGSCITLYIDDQHSDRLGDVLLQGCLFFRFFNAPRDSRASVTSLLVIHASVLSSSPARRWMADFISGVTLMVIMLSFFIVNFMHVNLDFTMISLYS